MTDYRGSQAWQDELIKLLRRGGNPPTKAVIVGRIDRRWSDERIADNWGALGARSERCTVKNVKFRWDDLNRALNGDVPDSGRGVRDIARDVAKALKEGLINSAATPEFMAAGDAYYRLLSEVDGAKIPTDWRQWGIRSR